MTNLKLDFSKVTCFNDIHTVIKEAFDFPDFYGENLAHYGIACMNSVRLMQKLKLME